MFSIDLNDPNDIVITVPQADLSFISGTLYEHDTVAFRLELISWEDSEIGMSFPRTHNHNTTVSIAGAVYARTIEMLAPYSIQYETGTYSVRLAGSNNNFFDVESGILVQNTVQVIANNSAGLQQVTSGSGVTAQDIIDISDRSSEKVWDAQTSNHAVAGSFGEWATDKLLTVLKFLSLK